MQRLASCAASHTVRGGMLRPGATEGEGAGGGGPQAIGTQQ